MSRCRNDSKKRGNKRIFPQRKLHASKMLLRTEGSSEKESPTSRWKFHIRQRIRVRNFDRRYSFLPEISRRPARRVHAHKWKKAGAFEFYGRKIRGISVLCKVHRARIVAENVEHDRFARACALFAVIYPVTRSHRESPLYTLSRIISRTVGTSLLRFILRKSLVRAWRERADLYDSRSISLTIARREEITFF